MKVKTKIDQDKLKVIIKKIMIAEKKNLAQKLFTEAQMLKRIRGYIEEVV